MKTLNYQSIKEDEQRKISELFTSMGVFFAFSNEQFEKNKTPLQEGEKYVSIGGGGYLPKHNVQAFSDGMGQILKTTKLLIKQNKAKAEQIRVELANYECYYTGDISPVVELTGYTPEEVRAVYNSERKNHLND